MQISPPFGYQEVVPFLKTHKVRLLQPAEAAPFARQGAAVPISHTEFQPAGRHYPIVFLGDGTTFNAVVIVGMSQGENLFVADGAWVGGVYIPAYARRYPFCMATVKVNNVAQQERLICVEKAALDENGEAMFDADVKPTEKWKGLERLLAEYEADLDRTREMCAILADYGLLEPFTMQAKMNPDKGGAALQMTGMHRVAEGNIENLNAAQLKNLVRKGILGRIYIHLLSHEHFAGLLERKAARARAA